MAFHRSQFYTTFRPAPNLDKKHTVFGKTYGRRGGSGYARKVATLRWNRTASEARQKYRVRSVCGITPVVFIAEKNVVDIKIPSRTTGTKFGW